MNWIFEIYGDTYNAMLMQQRRPMHAPAADGPRFNAGSACDSLPLRQAIASIRGRNCGDLYHQLGIGKARHDQ